MANYNIYFKHNFNRLAMSCPHQLVNAKQKFSRSLYKLYVFLVVVGVVDVQSLFFSLKKIGLAPWPETMLSQTLIYY